MANAQQSSGAAPSWGRPVVPSTSRLRPLGIADTKVTGGFWADRQRLNATTMLAHCERWVEAMGWTGNFDAARDGRLPQDRRGREFADSDVYKLIEAMAWEVGRTGDTEIDRRLRALVDRIAPVQEPDGYLNTMFGRPGQAARYSNLEWGHELYCFGHLIQAGVARARTHGSDTLVDIAVRAADHVCDQFGPDGLNTVDGHPEIEVALAELARLTGERRYLDQAARFVDRRGHRLLGTIAFGAEYFQDDVPVREAGSLRGHAVRALYLAAGAADVAVERDDRSLFEAVVRQTRSTLARRTYVTGGMGAHHEGESFGLDYELPPDRAYAETCAGVGSVMVNYRLLLATGEAEYADAIERALFNVVATSPAADGRSFFYTNTLHQRVPGAVPNPEVPSPRAASSLRAPWFDVSCCPTNVARTLASMSAYVATCTDDGLQVHQYAAADIRATLARGHEVAVQVQTRYPEDGEILIVVVETPPHQWTLQLRIPMWAATGATLHVGEERTPVSPGYAAVTRTFSVGDVIHLRLPVEPRWTRPHPRIDAVRGSVAVERGPLVLCMESVDLGASVNDVVVDTSTAPSDRDGVTFVRAGTARLAEPSWPYGGDDAAATAVDLHEVPMIAYHEWANRGPATMRVWLPELDSAGSSPVDSSSSQ